MSIAYIEPIGGAAGNMLLGALIDAGASPEELEATLQGVVATGWRLESRHVRRRGIAATHVDFCVAGEDGAPGNSAHQHTKLAAVLEILAQSRLSATQKTRAASVYEALANAEARVHGSTIDEVRFHEVGALDAILDIAGFVIACDLLGIESIVCDRLPIGTGDIEMAHGRYPNPPPVTADLMRGVPAFDAGLPGELVTPTAAAILRTLASRFGTRPEMSVDAIGYGAGTRDSERPNVTRVSIGAPLAPDADGAAVSILEANIDDMSPQHFELAVERLFEAGALDVWLAPITMKKGRPAIMLSAIVPPALEATCALTLMRETTTIGVRVRSERRYTLDRTIRTLDTPFGPVRVKDTRIDGTRRSMPEYDDLARIARERSEPLHHIARAVHASLEQT